MIYWFTGQPGHGKTVLSLLLKGYLEKTYHKNVIHIDGDDLRAIYENKDYSKDGRIKNITFAQNLAHFCNVKGFDVVVSLVSPYKEVRDSFKEKLKGQIHEIYVHTTDIRGREHFHSEDYERPTENYIDVDTTNIKPNSSLNEIIKNI